MPVFDEAIASLIRLSMEGHLCARESELQSPLPSSDAIVRDGDRIYLQKNWAYETAILDHVRRLKNAMPTPLFDRPLFLQNLERETALLPQQKQALKRAFNETLFVLSGGPGTGKTYTAVSFVRLLLASLLANETLHLCIAAPTGKAATHLQQILTLQNPSLRCEATTLHRLLKLQPGANRLFSNWRIDADLILVDEASMIDVSLLAHLLEAVGSGSRLILMGDPDQLPPVEQGSLFAELSTLFGISLKQCMRTEETALADAIRKGETEIFEKHHLDWLFDRTLAQKLFERIQPICSWEKPDPRKCIDHYNRLRILNALRQGPFGAAELNRQIAQRLKEQAGSWHALPILITANDPYSGLYNGMTGILLSQKSGVQEAYFPDRPDPIIHLPPYEYAFCLSVHKSQGSEFDEVIALFPTGSEQFGRESLYTAVTRAKKRFQWVGEEEILRAMANRWIRKRSGLIERFNAS